MDLWEPYLVDGSLTDLALGITMHGSRMLFENAKLPAEVFRYPGFVFLLS